MKIPITSSEDQTARQYTAEYAGEVTDDTFTRMDAEQAELDAVVDAYEDAKIAYENGEIYTLLSSFSIPAWSAPARNLSMLEEFPLNCSSTIWLVMLYAYRWLCLFCGAVIVLLISSRIKCIEAAYIAVNGVMLIPSLLYAYMGLEVFRPLAFITSVEAVPLLIRTNGAITQFLLWGVALTMIAGLAIG